MKKARRILLRSIAGAVTLAAAVLLVSLDTVDDRPYFLESYYAETAARLHAGRATNTVLHGPLAAGFGDTLLTPHVGAAQDAPLQGEFRSIPLAGYGNRKGKSATGVHDDLHVKAVALRVGDQLGVMVGVDALIVPPEVAEAAAEQLEHELGLPRSQLYLSATHTHASLGAWGEGFVAEAFAGGFQPGARIWFADRIVTAVRAAVADLKPASFARGRFPVTDFVRNRVVGPLGKVDPEFSFAVLKQQDGRLGILGSYAAHATVLSSGVMEFSGDYPGAWQRAVEETTGGVAVFLAGGMGSHSPVAGEKAFAGTERMGQALARPLLDQLVELSFTNAISFGTLGLELTLPPLNWRVTDSLRLRPWLARRLLNSRDYTFLQVFRLGDTVWISTPCDFSGELALELKDTLRARGFDAVTTSFNGDYVGYVIPARYYHLGGYEPRVMSFFGPNVPDYFDEMIREMALDLASR